MDAEISKVKDWGFSPSRSRLSRLYHQLSQCFERVEAAEHGVSRVEEVAVLVVLADDLRSLLEECEEFMFGGQGLRASQFQSFESRSFTVLEEIHELSFLRLAPGGESAASELRSPTSGSFLL